MYRSSKQKGFTLIELTVSIGIMVAVLAVVLLNQRNYTEAAALSNLADDLSLTISQARAYGIAVREVEPGTANFNAAYGISMSLLGSGSNSAYLFFVDKNNNTFYDGGWDCPIGENSECLEKVNFIRGNYIDSFCIVRTSGGDQCGSVSRVDITFLRPDTKANLVFFNNGGQQYNPSNTKGIKIVLKSPGGLTREVTVYNTGQISVQ